MAPEQFDAMIAKLAAGTANAADSEALRLALTTNGLSALQLGKYNINISQGQNVQIGDSLYFPALNDEAMQAIAHHIVQKLQASPQPASSPTKSVDALVQQVRSRLHDDIQRLHGTMPLWGVDHWVPLGELFVDVNILEELSSSRRSELADLWQDFNKNPSYRSLDRIGLGGERERVSGLEVLAKHTHLMVVGKPGSGKTTYLQRVVTECNAGNLQAHKIPVLIRLREFIEDGRDIGYSLERYLERCWQLSAIETQLVLNQGRSLLLLDGLDEVTGDDGKTITKQIKQFARAYPQVQMAVTCRTQSQESRFERFDYVEVADFNEPQVRAFAEHWFQTVCPAQGAGQIKAQVFLEQLFQEANKQIRELAITPILLSLTCAVFQQTGKFYSKRSRLYEEGLELLLEQWDKSREIERDELYRNLSVERKLELLSHLAVKKFEQEQYVLFEQAELEGYIADFLGIELRESRGVLKAIESQHGLLIERSQKVWSFSHLTFQEYLIAQYFSQVDWKYLMPHITKPHFREVLMLIPEITIKIDELVALIKSTADSMISEHSNVQRVLELVDLKSSKISSPFRLMFVRNFYLSFLFPSLAMSSRLNNDSGKRVYHTYTSCEQGDLGPKIGFMRLQRDSPGFAKGKNKSEVASYFFTNRYGISLNFSLLELCTDHSKDIQNLYNKIKIIPNPFRNKDKFNVWLAKHSDIWFSTVQGMIKKCPEDIYPSNFSDEDRTLFEKYYRASLLLFEYTNTNYLTEQIRQEIEETLFVPIAEIEKRKRKN